MAGRTLPDAIAYLRAHGTRVCVAAWWSHIISLDAGSRVSLYEHGAIAAQVLIDIQEHFDILTDITHSVKAYLQALKRSDATDENCANAHQIGCQLFHLRKFVGQFLNEWLVALKATITADREQLVPAYCSLLTELCKAGEVKQNSPLLRHIPLSELSVRSEILFSFIFEIVKPKTRVRSTVKPAPIMKKQKNLPWEISKIPGFAPLLPVAQRKHVSMELPRGTRMDGSVSVKINLAKTELASLHVHLAVLIERGDWDSKTSYLGGCKEPEAHYLLFASLLKQISSECVGDSPLEVSLIHGAAGLGKTTRIGCMDLSKANVSAFTATKTSATTLSRSMSAGHASTFTHIADVLQLYLGNPDAKGSVIIDEVGMFPYPYLLALLWTASLRPNMKLLLSGAFDQMAPVVAESVAWNLIAKQLHRARRIDRSRRFSNIFARVFIPSCLGYHSQEESKGIRFLKVTAACFDRHCVPSKYTGISATNKRVMKYRDASTTMKRWSTVTTKQSTTVDDYLVVDLVNFEKVQQDHFMNMQHGNGLVVLYVALSRARDTKRPLSVMVVARKQEFPSIDRFLGDTFSKFPIIESGDPFTIMEGIKNVPKGIRSHTSPGFKAANPSFQPSTPAIIETVIKNTERRVGVNAISAKITHHDSGRVITSSTVMGTDAALQAHGGDITHIQVQESHIQTLPPEPSSGTLGNKVAAVVRALTMSNAATLNQHFEPEMIMKRREVERRIILDLMHDCHMRRLKPFKRNANPQSVMALTNETWGFLQAASDSVFSYTTFGYRASSDAPAKKVLSKQLGKQIGVAAARLIRTEMRKVKVSSASVKNSLQKASMVRATVRQLLVAKALKGEALSTFIKHGEVADFFDDTLDFDVVRGGDTFEELVVSWKYTDKKYAMGTPKSQVKANGPKTDAGIDAKNGRGQPVNAVLRISEAEFTKCLKLRYTCEYLYRCFDKWIFRAGGQGKSPARALSLLIACLKSGMKFRSTDVVAKDTSQNDVSKHCLLGLLPDKLTFMLFGKEESFDPRAYLERELAEALNCMTKTPAGTFSMEGMMCSGWILTLDWNTLTSIVELILFEHSKLTFAFAGNAPFTLSATMLHDWDVLAHGDVTLDLSIPKDFRATVIGDDCCSVVDQETAADPDHWLFAFVKLKIEADGKIGAFCNYLCDASGVVLNTVRQGMRVIHKHFPLARTEKESAEQEKLMTAYARSIPALLTPATLTRAATEKINSEFHENRHLSHAATDLIYSFQRPLDVVVSDMKRSYKQEKVGLPIQEIPWTNC